jgi:hypothetical protein
VSGWDGVAPKALFKSVLNLQVPVWLNWVQHTREGPPESFAINSYKRKQKL